MPHKTLDNIFRPKVSAGNILARLRDLITTPVISEKYGYSIRINEARLLPEEISRIGAFHRQKLKKSVVTISVNEDYEINDLGCYRIRRLEENLYESYLPKDYKCDNVITYQWQQNRDHNMQGHFNFYYNITKDTINGRSMTLYMIVLMALAVCGEMLADLVRALIDILK
jgi:hypothetical protein